MIHPWCFRPKSTNHNSNKPYSKVCFFFFRNKKARHFVGTSCPADDSQEISSLILWKKQTKKQFFTMPSASYFFLLFGFYGPFKNFSLISSWSFIKGGLEKTGEPGGKTTWPSISSTWLSQMWPEWGSNHSGEKPNGLRVSSLIHQAMGAACFVLKGTGYTM